MMDENQSASRLKDGLAREETDGRTDRPPRRWKDELADGIWNKGRRKEGRKPTHARRVGHCVCEGAF